MLCVLSIPAMLCTWSIPAQLRAQSIAGMLCTHKWCVAEGGERSETRHSSAAPEPYVPLCGVSSLQNYPNAAREIFRRINRPLFAFGLAAKGRRATVPVWRPSRDISRTRRHMPEHPLAGGAGGTLRSPIGSWRTPEVPIKPAPPRWAEARAPYARSPAPMFSKGIIRSGSRSSNLLRMNCSEASSMASPSQASTR